MKVQLGKYCYSTTYVYIRMYNQEAHLYDMIHRRGVTKKSGTYAHRVLGENAGALGALTKFSIEYGKIHRKYFNLCILSEKSR